MIVGKSLDELAELKTEIEQNLASDRSFALELQYWSNILKKIDEQIAKTQIEDIYNEYFQENKDKIMQEIQLAEAKKRAQMKNAGAYSKVKDYQTPFTALQIDNTKRGMSVAGKQEEEVIVHSVANMISEIDDMKYNDGTLSPILIPFDEAGYLLSLAITDQ